MNPLAFLFPKKSNEENCYEVNKNGKRINKKSNNKSNKVNNKNQIIKVIK